MKRSLLYTAGLALVFALVLLVLGCSENTVPPAATGTAPAPASAPKSSGQAKDIVRVLDPTEKNAFRNEEKVALVVGVGAYPSRSGLGKLQYAAADAELLGKQLRKLGYKVVVETDTNATGGVIRKHLDELSQLIDRDQGTFLFAFSGHGFADAASDVNYIAPYETVVDDVKGSGLKLADVLKRMKDSGAKRQVILVDACRNDPSRPGAKDVAGGRGFVSFKEAEGYSILFSTKFGGKSYEYSELGHGAFTHFVVDGLNGKAATPEGYLTFRGLADYVARQVKDYSFGRQNIQVPFAAGEAMGDILIGATAQAGVSAATPVAVPGVPAKPEPAVTAAVAASPPAASPVASKPPVPAPVIATSAAAVASNKPSDGKQPHTFRDKLNDGGEGPEMVVIPSGRFLMGSPENEEGRSDYEGPQHEVKVKSFALGKHELTVGEFKRFVMATGYDMAVDKDCYKILSSGKIEWQKWSDPRLEKMVRKLGIDEPVACVSWDDVKAYGEWLSLQTGKVYRLPSEAEWEYAARAGSKTAYFWGNRADDACKFANVLDGTAKKIFLGIANSEEQKQQFPPIYQHQMLVMTD